MLRVIQMLSIFLDVICILGKRYFKVPLIEKLNWELILNWLL